MKTQILVRGSTYNFIIDGKGTPCLIIGLASIPFKALPSELKNKYRFISSDIYWGSENNSLDLSKVDLEYLVEDINGIRLALQLDKLAILAHSAFGLLAFEYALKYRQNVSEIIAVASPPCWTNQVLSLNGYFEQEASTERKMKFQQDQLALNRIKEDEISRSDMWILQYNACNAKYWYDFNKDNTIIWRNVCVNTDLFQHFFGGILLNYDKREEYKHLDVPIFLALGRYDYVVPPLLWTSDNRIKDFSSLSLYLYKKSAHYPMLEEVEKFTKEVIHWNNSLLK